MANATAELGALLKKYKDVGGYLHPSLREPYARESAQQLRELRRLLRSGANWRAGGDRDAAFTAAFFNDPRPLEVMLELGVPVEHARADGTTLLHHAAAFGRKQVVKLLAERGASVLARDRHGKTPLDRARAWRHGEDALPLLTRLTKAAAKAAAKTAAKPAATGELSRDAVRVALKAKPRGFSASALRALKTFAEAAFATSPTTTNERFLADLAQQSTDAEIAAGLAVVASATTAKPTTRRVKGGEQRIVHHGDLVITGDCDALVIAVTGSLTVKGRLTNWEGRSVHVGGSLVADAVASEGPLWVQGDATIKHVVLATYNDYALTVVGTLATPVLIQEDAHAMTIGTRKIGRHYRAWKAVPARDVPKLRKALRLR